MNLEQKSTSVKTQSAHAAEFEVNQSDIEKTNNNEDSNFVMITKN